MGVSPTRSPAARSADPASAMTLPFPLVPATSAPRTASWGSPIAAQQRPHAPEPEADPEATARLDRGERLRVREIGRPGRVLTLAAGAHDFVSSSS